MAEFIGSSYVKICGVTRAVDVETVVASGADGLGLILSKSSRQLTLDAARPLAHAARGRVLVTAVFRGRDDAFILESARSLEVDVVQLHDHLSTVLREELHVDGRLIVKALAIDSGEFLDFDDTLVDAIMVDGPTSGSGVPHSWDRLAERTFRVPVIAAGGLAPANVADVVRLTGAWGVDVSSGVESSPGVKDPTLVGQFVERARRAMAGRAVT